MSTFVTIGNSLDPFPRLLDEVSRLAAAGLLPPPVVVQCGNTPFASEHCEVHRFFDREAFHQRLVEAELVITHGGLTVLSALRAGKTPVVMPRRGDLGEVSDNHQVEFCQPRAASGDIALAMEPEQLQEAVKRALAMQAASARNASSRPDPPLVVEIKELLKTWSKQRSGPAVAGAAKGG